MDQPDLKVLAEAIPALRASVDTLGEHIQGLHGQVDFLRVYGRQNRKLIWRQWITIAAVALLAVGWLFTSVKAQRNAAALQRFNERAIVTCQAQNNARALNRQLWDYVLTFPPVQKLSPEEQARHDTQVAQFKAFIARTVAEQDCQKLDQPVTGTVKG